MSAVIFQQRCYGVRSLLNAGDTILKVGKRASHLLHIPREFGMSRKVYAQ